MRDRGYFLVFVIAVFLQILANNFLHLPSYLIICILPTLICLAPLRIRTPFLLIIAFITAFATDFLSSGILGLTAVSLLPVAFCRDFFYKLFIGKESFVRQDELSSKKHGFFRVSALLIPSLLIYFLIFVLADAAGTQPLLFNGLRLLCSTVSSFLLSILLVKVIAP
ncbi:MAG: hypothetical protein KBS36_02090 [Bacteroidales bacterium]|nr:hypothetical protein [Candidatus Cryptobacteroides fimicaballi]